MSTATHLCVCSTSTVQVSTPDSACNPFYTRPRISMFNVTCENGCGITSDDYHNRRKSSQSRCPSINFPKSGPALSSTVHWQLVFRCVKYLQPTYASPSAKLASAARRRGLVSSRTPHSATCKDGLCMSRAHDEPRLRSESCSYWHHGDHRRSTFGAKARHGSVS